MTSPKGTVHRAGLPALACEATSVAAPIVLGVMLQRGKFAGNNGSSEQEG
jgi:hypothetical protein